MRKTFFVFCIIALAFSACTKDGRISRQLNGSWNCTMNENVIISPQTKYEYHFKKEKGKSGNGYTVIAYPGFYSEKHFTYEISDEQLKVNFEDSTNFTYDVTEHNKNKIVLTNMVNGKITNLRAK